MIADGGQRPRASRSRTLLASLQLMALNLGDTVLCAGGSKPGPPGRRAYLLFGCPRCNGGSVLGSRGGNRYVAGMRRTHMWRPRPAVASLSRPTFKP